MRAVKDVTRWALLAVTFTALVAGGVAWLLDARAVADGCWIAGTVAALIPALWWVVYRADQPEGALLLSPFPDQGSVELVYLGLGPSLRGRGLGKLLMVRAIDAARRSGAMDMTCAVDMQNLRALRLYAGLGFRSIDRRVALVRSIGRSGN